MKIRNNLLRKISIGIMAGCLLGCPVQERNPTPNPFVQESRDLIRAERVYPANSTGVVNVNVRLYRPDNMDELLSLALTETIPDGWTYNSLPVSPPGYLIGLNGKGPMLRGQDLEFIWITPPAPDEFPIEFTYKLNTGGGTGNKTITGKGSYNVGTPNDEFFDF